MIKKAMFAIAIMCSVVFAAPPAPHVIDQSHSQINFVAEARFISAHGHFDKWEAEVNLLKVTPFSCFAFITSLIF